MICLFLHGESDRRLRVFARARHMRESERE